jgi:hypothetical protein
MTDTEHPIADAIRAIHNVTPTTPWNRHGWDHPAATWQLRTAILTTLTDAADGTNGLTPAAVEALETGRDVALTWLVVVDGGQLDTDHTAAILALSPHRWIGLVGEMVAVNIRTEEEARAWFTERRNAHVAEGIAVLNSYRG